MPFFAARIDLLPGPVEFAGAQRMGPRTLSHAADAARGTSHATTLTPIHRTMDLDDFTRCRAPKGLTRRECDMLALVADGRSNREIGERLASATGRSRDI
jgi:ATP/maltotriose-dependent transcriptional regulator MalT